MFIYVGTTNSSLILIFITNYNKERKDTFVVKFDFRKIEFDS